MSRNSEKAQSMLYKWRAQQAAQQGVIDSSGRRPRNIMECTSVAACEKWRNQVLKDVTRKIDKINDATLTDFQVRDLNDEINKLQKEKHMWELQLKNIGGTNYIRFQGNVTDSEGRVIGSHKGYKYYGRAKELPGIKELFSELAAPPKHKKTKQDWTNLDLDISYYGYRDEEDPALLAYEEEREEEARTNLMAETKGDESRWDVANIPKFEDLPSRAEIEQILVEKRKAILLAKYQ
ncbi:Pre-mRNA-splicing factor isy-1 [Taphrina deformans PYCC 5710]|uniref:Pre-mRNA-splicing factor isy-1 n=1 Tax=Taphrina deformans (strain PYCC 5710 / ATCC 11124 / CBS 356.35 / IMI 108563 / JCM 9778 / NBRC 8474) TaxID=1097556 RepID=R4XGW6_TAPDE|nr:Pre-mRNA-splicing factor isy-1 [Taphrina deformans PYCC 5710]|eukprot:CCG82601.1 Pre-mRNA-splicing factor isy-1 [Taphrina deformans PYCC 5710]